MTRVAVLGSGVVRAPIGDGRTDAELLAPAVDRALALSGCARHDVGVLATAGSEFLAGVVGTVMGMFDAVPGWPPRTHSHLDGDGAWALHEAWVRLLAGEARVALVAAVSRPQADDPAALLGRRLDPLTVAPLGPGAHEIAALQARALLDAGRADRDVVTRVVAARRRLPAVVVAAAPVLASPLRALDAPTPCAGAAAVVLAVADAVPDPGTRAARPAWITGLAHRAESSRLGARDLDASPSVAALATDLGVRGRTLDVAELHAAYAHEEALLLEALGAAGIGRVSPSGGALVGDAPMVSGLARVAAAAEAVQAGAAVAVAHAANGPALQQNLLCVLEAEA